MGTRIRTSQAGPLRSAIAVVLGATLIAACSAGAGGAASTVEEGAGSAGSASPIPSPTPTAAPTPVEELFVERLAELESASGSIEGSIRAGELELPVAGSFAFQGTDYQMRMTVGSGTDAQTSETIQLDGRTYTREGDGPWLAAPQGTSADVGAAPDAGMAAPETGAGSGPGQADVRALLRRLDEVRPAGTVLRGGQRLQRLVLPADASVDMDDAGILPAGAEDGELTLSFLAGEDGRLAVMKMDASWTQATGRQTIAAVVAIEMTFDRSPASRPILRPADVWVRQTAIGLGYSFALPEEWEVIEVADGLALQGPGGDSIEILSTETEPGMTLNQWSSGAVAAIHQDFGVKPTANEAVMVCEIPARLLSYTATYDGIELYGMDAVFVTGDRGYGIFWFSTPGNEAADRELFLRFLALVEFPPDVHSPPAVDPLAAASNA